MLQQDLSNITYDGTKEQLTTFLSSNPQFTDLNYGGANLAYLLDMLTFVAYNTNVYNSFALNETFVDTATQRENVVAHAKMTGYIPKSITSATMQISVNLDIAKITNDGVAVPEQISLPAGAKFSVKLLNTTYTYSTLHGYTIYNAYGSLALNDVILYEGIPRTLTATFDPINNIILPIGCDTATIGVTVNGVTYTKAVNGINNSANSTVFYVFEDSQGKFEIYFGDGITSAQPPLNSSIVVTYLESAGENANAGNASITLSYNSNFINNNIDYTKYVTFDVITTPSGGASRESIDTIRKNSTFATISQNRGVTVADYRYVLETSFQNYVLRANSWDVNSLPVFDPMLLGNVYICMQPQNYRVNLYLGNTTKNNILKSLSGNYIVGGTRPIIVDPIYLYINHNVTIFYDPAKLVNDFGVIKNNIKTNIRALYDSEIIKFNTYLPISRIQSTVDASDLSIVSSNITYTVTTSLVIPISGTSVTYNLLNELQPGSFTFGASVLGTLHEDSVTGHILDSSNNVVGIINYAVGDITINTPVSVVSNSNLLQMTFSVVNVLQTQRNLILIDSDTYTWVETPIQ